MCVCSPVLHRVSKMVGRFEEEKVEEEEKEEEGNEIRSGLGPAPSLSDGAGSISGRAMGPAPFVLVGAGSKTKRQQFVSIVFKLLLNLTHF